MAKKITSLNISNESIEIADRIGAALNISRSAVFDYVMNAHRPFANQISHYHYEVKKLEERFLNQSVDAHLSSVRGKPEITREELFSSAWKHNIKSQLYVPSFEHYRHNTSDGTMGKGEKKIIEEQLESFVDTYRMKGAIHIKTDRIVDTNGPNARGCSSTILIKEKSWNGYFFDFNHIVTLPISDLIIFGVKEVLKREKIYFDAPYICWINIYHTNDLAVMIPIIREEEISDHRKNEKSIIIINPFTRGAKK
ncbi:TPA: hypothetical protein LSH87_000700 [Citrobacter koseri]|uniref:hypothetical protein n=1 Tax=Citrobacter koseri TaxID=545 RepID=UPI0023AE87B7|nr:hypothetical protein [Citrobacter koseri]HBL6926807.1 hypothetical protein [Citrobacter koseri]HBL6927770.1 hypothetical protein [Citrobacter koseri]